MRSFFKKFLGVILCSGAGFKAWAEPRLVNVTASEGTLDSSNGASQSLSVSEEKASPSQKSPLPPIREINKPEGILLSEDKGLSQKKEGEGDSKTEGEKKSSEENVPVLQEPESLFDDPKTDSTQVDSEFKVRNIDKGGGTSSLLSSEPGGKTKDEEMTSSRDSSFRSAKIQEKKSRKTCADFLAPQKTVQYPEMANFYEDVSRECIAYQALSYEEKRLNLLRPRGKEEVRAWEEKVRQVQKAKKAAKESASNTIETYELVSEAFDHGFAEHMQNERTEFQNNQNSSSFDD